MNWQCSEWRTTSHLHIRRRLGWLTFVVAFLSAAAIAQPVLPDQAETVAVTGVVVDEQDKPFAGVQVVAIFNNETSTRTNSEGAFTLSVPPKTKYWTIVARTADESLIGHWESDHGNHLATADKITEPLQIVLKPSRAISVVVVDTGDKPLADIEVVCQGYYQYLGLSSVRTDDNGKAILRVPEGCTLGAVFAHAPGIGFDYQLFRRRSEQGTDAQKLPQEHDEPLKFVLKGTRPVSVRVTDPDGVALAGVKVRPSTFELPGKGHKHSSYMNLVGTRFSQTTDEHGVARFDFLPQGIVGSVTFWADLDDRHFQPDRANFDPKSDSNEITTVLHAKSRLSGQVLLPDGKPAPKAQVRLAGDGRAFDSNFRQNIEADEKGNFEVYVNSNVYCMVEARLDRFVSKAVPMVILEGDSPAPLELRLETASRLLGRITEGEDAKPVVGQTVRIQHHPTPDYYQLPPSERKIPNPTNTNDAVTPYLNENLTTDSEGRYEYFVGPGTYYIIGPNHNAPRPKVDVTELADYETDLHAPRPETVNMTGTVLSSTGKPVPYAKILGVPTNWEGRRFETDGDATGQYRVVRTSDRMWVQAESPDGKEIGIVMCDADATHLDIFIGPPAVVRGKLVDADTGEALAGMSIQYQVRVHYESKDPAISKASNFILGGVAKTDANGRFELTRVAPGWPYGISWVHSFHEGGIVAKEVTGLKSVEPKEPGPLDLGILKARKK